MLTKLSDKELRDVLQKVGEHFRLEGAFDHFNTITCGNINNTFEVCYRDPDKSYLFQRVNTYVFKNPRQIMHNIDLVTTHIREKAGGKRHTMHYHHDSDGNNFWFDDNSNFWRVSNYVVEANTYQITDDPHVLHMAGRAFGEFQEMLSDFNASQLFETIPDFHNTEKRLEKFFKDVKEDSFNRVKECRAEIDYIASVREKASLLSRQLKEGKIPLRVTHNDTKINNVLFRPVTNEPIVVIDLDTVMPGLAAHDFGDAVRFAANTAEEDEKDVSKVSLNLDLYRAFAEGFVEATASVMKEEELKSLALGAFTITVELASRFLDDYLTGDKYFKTCYPGHNLVRTRCQLALAKDMETKFDEMNKIVEETALKNR